MELKRIISNNFQDLNLIAQNEKNNYSQALPFPNIVFNNFFKNDFLDTILKEFPDLSKLDEFVGSIFSTLNPCCFKIFFRSFGK